MSVMFLLLIQCVLHSLDEWGRHHHPRFCGFWGFTYHQQELPTMAMVRPPFDFYTSHPWFRCMFCTCDCHRLMVITGLITLVISVIFWFFFPDSPMTAHFLTEDERLIAVERIKVNQAGVENKHFKRDQYGPRSSDARRVELTCLPSRFVETLRDPKTYLLFFFAASSNVVNSVRLLRAGMTMFRAQPLIIYRMRCSSRINGKSSSSCSDSPP